MTWRFANTPKSCTLPAVENCRGVLSHEYYLQVRNETICFRCAIAIYTRDAIESVPVIRGNKDHTEKFLRFAKSYR